LAIFHFGLFNTPLLDVMFGSFCGDTSIYLEYFDFGEAISLEFAIHVLDAL
jgi:hypothetical protein